MSWLTDERTGAATERILDAAGRLYAEHGLGVGMDTVAKEAGCSRATLYRYFPNRHDLRTAFAHREAQHVVAQVSARVAAIESPEERVVAAVLAALAEVRARPHLLAWYASVDVAVLTEILQESPLIAAVTAGFVGDPDGPPDLDLAHWVLRSILSFLTFPGRDAAEERRLVERFLSPHLTAR